jgi:integrase/recombinase XerD
MEAAGLPEGPHRSPKGLRHGFGVHAISSGVPLNMLGKWMGCKRPPHPLTGCDGVGLLH